MSTSARRRVHATLGTVIIALALVGLVTELSSPHRYPAEPPEPEPRVAQAPARASDNRHPTASAQQEETARRHLASARAYADGKDLPATIAQLDAIIGKAPNSSLAPDAMYQKGIAYNALGEYRKALEAWHQLQTTYPDHRLSIRALAALQPTDAIPSPLG